MPQKKKVAVKEGEGTKPKLRIKLRAYDHKVIDTSAKQIMETVLRHGGGAGSDVLGPIPLPTEIQKFPVNRSSFVPKDAT